MERQGHDYAAASAMAYAQQQQRQAANMQQQQQFGFHPQHQQFPSTMHGPPFIPPGPGPAHPPMQQFPYHHALQQQQQQHAPPRSQLMVKTKQNRTGKIHGKKADTSSRGLVDSENCDNDHDGDSDWIIVKKQRVTILVPAAPLNDKSLTENQGPNHMHLMPPEMANNHVQLPMETSTIHPSGNEHEKTTLLAVQNEAHTDRRTPPTLPRPTVINQPSLDQRIESENPHQMTSSKSHKLLGISDTSKLVKLPRTLLVPRRSSNLESLNKNLRASNLERKLERAGGLSKWLTSLGLGQFVRIFQGKSLSKYQLVNLTMKKLKDMGASAVGPRRKLIHAMDCVCQPYCFEAL